MKKEFYVSTHIAKKEVEIERHRDAIAYLKDLDIRPDVMDYMMAIISSRIALCEISIQQHIGRHLAI